MTVPRPTPLNFESGRSGSCRVRQESIGINHVVTVWHDSRVRVRTAASSAVQSVRARPAWRPSGLWDWSNSDNARIRTKRSL